MKIFSFLALSFVLFSCSKSNSPVTPVSNNDPAQYGTPYTGIPAKKDAIIYQVNIRAFSSAGNLNGVTARLDSIKALGTNVLYLMPIYPVGTLNGINSPYAIKDYKAIGTEFGTLADLRVLVDAAHNKNMAVVLDWVANHTAWDNVWISNKAWYKQDAAGNIVSPAGYNDVAQLNFNNSDMRNAMIEAMRYWVFTANVDGFRCDFADNVPLDFWKQAITSLKGISTRKLLYFAEGTRSDNFRIGFDLNFGFAFFGKMEEIYKENKSATGINDVNRSEFLNVFDESQVVRYTTNHDVNSSDGTPQELFGGEKGSLAAFVIAAYMKGIPMIYSGQEVGTSYRIPFPFTSKKIDWSVNPGITLEYKKILAFRNNSAAIRGGQLFSYSSDDVVAFTKQQDNEKVWVMVNLRNKTVEYTLPATVANTTWSDALNGGSVALTTKVVLQPYSYKVLKN
ncbi:MAG: alpha-amylase family glycosyl hydrolase [Bacteroidota bacterium]